MFNFRKFIFTMKIFYSFVIFIFLISCKKDNNTQQSYANEIEKKIIDKMYCWRNYESEKIDNQIIITDDKKEEDKLFDRRSKLDELAYKNGREKLKNDTLFINIIRNDSLLNNLKNERAILANKILTYNKSITFFNEYIEKINKDIVEYNYFFFDEFGIYEYPPIKSDEIILRDKTFYKSYTELLKESYKLNENSKITEENIISLNEALVSLEKIDRKLWCVKYYNEARQNLEKEKLERERKTKIDSLLK